MRRTALLAALLIGCASPSHPGDPGHVTPGVQVQSGREFDIAFDQEVEIQGTGLTIRFVGVGEDSRCAVDVQCVWAGNAVVRLVLSSPGLASAEAALNTTLEPRAANYAGHSIRLAGLKPVPRSGTTIQAASYVATLEVRPASG